MVSERQDLFDKRCQRDNGETRTVTSYYKNSLMDIGLLFPRNSIGNGSPREDLIIKFPEPGGGKTGVGKSLKARENSDFE